MDTLLANALDEIGLALTDTQRAALLHYIELLQKWNKVYNLTAVRDPQEMLRLHLLDCLAVMPLFARQIELAAQALEDADGVVHIMDVGAGGGLPGVVLAICFPNVQVTCVDAVAKKMAFVQQAALQLGLPNLQAIHSRVEQLNGQYDLVTSRAFASLQDFVELTRSKLKDAGVWMAMKGKYPEDEIAALPEDVRVFHVEHVSVPGLDAERCVVQIVKHS